MLLAAARSSRMVCIESAFILLGRVNDTRATPSATDTLTCDDDVDEVAADVANRRVTPLITERIQKDVLGS